jgi:hypothetical protein
MRKKDIIADGKTEYFAAEGRSYLYGQRRVVVIDADEHTTVSMRNVPREAVFADPAYQQAHFAWALTQAFANDCTPNEVNAAKRNLADAERQAQRTWFEADPSRMYRKGGYAGRYESKGALCRQVDKEGNLGAYVLVPTRDIRSTWADHVAEKEREEKARIESARRQAELKNLRARQRAVIKPALEAVFADSDVSGPYVSDYDRKVELSYEQLMVVLGVALPAEEAVA